MNRVIRYLIVAAVVFAAAASVCFACKPGDDWKERMKAAKIAFLTSEMDLTPDEAAKFWPLYNQYEKMKDEAFRAGRDSFMKLDQAVSEGKKNVSSLLDDYIEACSAVEGIEKEAVEAYKKVISVEKIARLYIGEEKFRRDQIQKLHRGGGER